MYSIESPTSLPSKEQSIDASVDISASTFMPFQETWLAHRHRLQAQGLSNLFYQGYKLIDVAYSPPS